MAKVMSPCYDEATKTDCPRRHGGCAINCPEWVEYVQKRDEENRRRYAEAGANSAIICSHMKHYDERKKRSIADRSRRRR